MITELIHTAVRNAPRKPYKGLHASALGYCPRVHYYKIKGIQATTPPNLGALMNFKMGDVWEGTLLKLIDGLDDVKIIKEDVKQQWHIPDLNLYGETDYPLEINGKKIIVDCKTVNSMWFKYVEHEWNKAKELGISKNEFLLKRNPEYEIQQGAYLLMAKLLGKKYDHATLLFVNKDNSFIGWEVDIYLTKDLENDLMEKIGDMNFWLKNNELPPCTCEGWKIGYCDYGNPDTRELNSKKKEVNTECCDIKLKGVKDESNG